MFVKVCKMATHRAIRHFRWAFNILFLGGDTEAFLSFFVTAQTRPQPLHKKLIAFYNGPTLCMHSPLLFGLIVGLKCAVSRNIHTHTHACMFILHNAVFIWACRYFLSPSSTLLLVWFPSAGRYLPTCSLWKLFVCVRGPPSSFPAGIV